jgi:FkbM family methyltransferase
VPRIPPRPAPFVLAATAHGSLIVNRHDVHRVGDQAYGVGHQLLTTGAFDPAEVELALGWLERLRAARGDGVTAVDCGANIGVHSIEWARHMHGWGSVLAFEAQERLYYALAGNLALNNCLNARAVWAAVGTTEGTLRIPVPDYCAPASFGSLELKDRANREYIGQAIDYSESATQPVRQVSLDALGLTRLDFLKIDVEGMEQEVLAGAAATIAAHRPVMLVEHIKSDQRALRHWAADRGYRLTDTGMNFLAVHEHDPLLPHASGRP